MVVFFDGLGDEGGDSMICNECETVSYCTKHGCIPKQSAPVQEFVALDALVKEEMRYYHDGHYLDSSDAKYQLRSFAHRISKSVRASTPPAAPVQGPVAWANPSDLKNFDMKVRTNGGPLHTVALCLCTPPAAQRQWAGLTDEDKLQIEIMGGKSDVLLAEMVETKLKGRNA
jgi:hypothetical protein